jgi:hypothetical protein
VSRDAGTEVNAVEGGEVGVIVGVGAGAGFVGLGSGVGASVGVPTNLGGSINVVEIKYRAVTGFVWKTTE